MFTENQIENIKEKAKKIAFDKFKNGNDRDAELICSQIIKVEPENIEMIQLLGLIKHKKQDYQGASEIFKMGIKIEPNNYENHNNLGLCLSAQGKYQDAILSLQEASRLRPDLDFILSNLGLQYRNEGNTKEAICFFKKSLAIKETAETLSMLGGCYGEVKMLEEAEYYFKKAISINPNFSGAHVDLASIYQFRGEWEKAWPEYEWRFKLYEQSKFWDIIFDPELRMKKGQNINGLRILVHPEQGTGDMIQFSRYLKHLRNLGAYVILHCWESLEKLLKEMADETYTAEPATIAKYQSRKESSEMPKYDLHCSIMSLPYLLSLDHIPNKPYIKASGAFDLSKYEKKIKVGIAWGGNPQHPNDKSRSCKLVDFKPIHDISNVKIFNLQKDMRLRKYRFDDEAIDLTEGAKDMAIVNMSELQEDFSATASIINSLDVVVTIDTAILHLAGAMGKRTIAMISDNCDWRWKLSGESTEWYPSVTLVRKCGESWNSAFAEAARIIREMN